MPEKPIMHGRDHRPGGTDPIPGLGGSLSWAIMGGTTSGLTVAASHHGEFSPNGSHFFTNAPSVFQSATNTDFSVDGIQILELGHYLVLASLAVTSFGAGSVDLVVSVAEGAGPSDWAGEFSMGEIVSSTPVYSGSNGIAALNTVFVADVTTGNGGLPPPHVWELTNSGANSATVVLNGYVFVQLDNVDTTIE